MKKILLMFGMLYFLTACIQVGKFPENRERLYKIGNDEEYCQQNPDKCIHGIPW